MPAIQSLRYSGNSGGDQPHARHGRQNLQRQPVDRNIAASQSGLAEAAARRSDGVVKDSVQARGGGGAPLCLVLAYRDLAAQPRESLDGGRAEVEAPWLRTLFARAWWVGR